MTAQVCVDGLVKSFGGFRALDGLDLEVASGEVRGFLGPNGSGKSTTIRILLGLQHRDAGTVQVLGLDPQKHPAEVTRQVAYVPGDVALWPNLTGQQVLDVLAGLRGAYDPTIERDLIAAFAVDTTKKVRTYSKGNRQKIALIAAFAARTPLLILDEPTSGLDPLMEEVFQGCVRQAAQAGRTVLLSSHILSEVERLCQTVSIIKDGKLVESGSLAELKHLAASQVSAHVPLGAVSETRHRLGQAHVAVPVGSDGSVTAAIDRRHVATVLGILSDAQAQDITCTPATLDDLFLRHYQVAAR